MLDTNRFTTVHKDIFESFEDHDFNFLFHAMNRKNNYRHGFSRQLANRYPKALFPDPSVDATAYEIPEKGSMRLSFLNMETNPNNLQVIVHLHCIRNNFKDGSLMNTKHLASALTEFSELFPASTRTPLRVGFTKFGTGISGGNWEEISQVINDNLNPYCEGLFFGTE